MEGTGDGLKEEGKREKERKESKPRHICEIVSANHKALPQTTPNICAIHDWSHFLDHSMFKKGTVLLITELGGGA